LQPYWKSEEIQAGLQWSGADPTYDQSETDDLETHFPDVLGFDGIAVATSSARSALELGLGGCADEDFHEVAERRR